MAYSTSHQARRYWLVSTLVVGALAITSTGNANPMLGRKMRAEAGSVLAADLHLVAERESRRRGVSLPAIVAPGEADLNRTADLVMMREGRVTVVVSSENPAALVPELQERGMTGIFVHDDLNHLRGEIPVEKLFTLEDLKGRGLTAVQPEYRPMTSAGAVTSQADWLMEADRVRDSTGGYDGTGQRIGTLSDSYNRNGGAAAGFASGDLPSVTMLQEGPTGTIDEGRAMIELMYDLAPGSTYAFATAFIGGQSGFASNITALAANTAQGRCTVIVDDVFYLAEPFFQDGVIAQAINTAVTTRNVNYFSAAGNLANQAWDGQGTTFVDAGTAQTNGANFAFFGVIGGVTQNDYQWLDFDPAGGIVPFQTVTLPASSSARLGLQWDDPYYAGGSVRNDLDFFVVNASTGALVSGSLGLNRGSAEPNELVEFASGSATTYRLYVGRYVAVGDPTASIDPAPTRVKWVNFGANGSQGLSSVSPGPLGPTITPHSAAVNAMSVAAVNYWDQQGFASFTSMGPATILFASNGTRLGTPVIRNKPDFAAIQATNTTFFFSGNDIEGDGFPNFSGTSAAAPHAAAVAALVRQRFPGETPAQIYQRLRDSADPGTNPSDRVGDGLINAWKSVYGDPVPVVPPYSNGFEAGFLDVEWETRRTGSQRIEVTGDHSPAAGGRHMVLHSSRVSTVGRAEATLHVDLTGLENVELSFIHRRAPGESAQAMPASFNGAANSDGVAYSIDGGATWKRIASLTGTNSTTSNQPFNFDLSTLAANNGDSLSGIVQIRFQEFDNQPAPTRGHYHDEVSITGTPVGEGMPGDVNGDGIVNVADVTLLKGFLEGAVPNLPEPGNADFNEDEDTNQVDVDSMVDFIVNN